LAALPLTFPDEIEKHHAHAAAKLKSHIPIPPGRT
jgi:hypothetical protein